MVEPLTLGAIVAALAAKALERAEEKTVEEGEGVLRRLVEALRRRFSDGEEQAGAMALERLEDAPDSPGRQRDLAQLLDERADAVPELRRELEAMVIEARDAGVDVESVSQLAFGNQNVQSAGLVDSEVNVTFGARPGGSQTSRSSQ